MVLNLIGFALLMTVFYKSKKNLITFMTYLTWYMVVRAIMEVFRVDAVSVGNVKIGVLGCSVLAAVSMVITVLIYCRKLHTGMPRMLEKEGETL